uniref:Uncharacterized protein n=1 Tax=Thermus islandicus TaxID=540988 RepID=A0A7C2C057_9DEIN
MALAWSSPVYLERQRLLELLPEAPGFAIWLEAPAGFGKSVLAGQDEEALLLLVEHCRQRGQKARALAHLERYRKQLWEELRERPSPQVEALIRSLQG